MEPILIKNINKFEDKRGLFYESFRTSAFKDTYEIEQAFVQDNHSVSCKNTIRGMHYQWDEPMGKLVRTATGAITDVVVDIRKDSITFGNVYYYELNDKNLHQLYIPPGFAHGFICRSETAIVLYKCTAEYNKQGESGINPFDKTLNIDWGIEYDEAIISEKDLHSQSIEQYLQEPKF
jgi:dTDP-4-dehydrorhamnose 3,5-epimerase